MVGRFKKWIAAHVVIAAVIGTLVLAGGAAAAWIILTSGATGTASTTIAVAPSMSEISVVDAAANDVTVVPCTGGSGNSCTGGTDGIINLNVKSNDPTATVMLTGMGVAFTTVPAACASHLIVKTISPSSGSWSPQQTKSGVLDFVADPSTPTTCSGATVTATFTGTTTP